MASQPSAAATLGLPPEQQRVLALQYALALAEKHEAPTADDVVADATTFANFLFEEPEAKPALKLVGDELSEE